MKAKRKSKPARRATAARLTTMRFADRLNDIASRLVVVHAAIYGIETLSDGDPATGPLASLVDEIRDQVRTVANDIHQGAVT